MELNHIQEIKLRIINTGRDTRYSIKAYEFFALVKDYLVGSIKKNNPDALDALRYRLFAEDIVKSAVKIAVVLYGPVAKHVLADMGILDAKDIGAVAFNLVSLGFLEQNVILSNYEDFVNISKKPLFGKIKPKPLNMEKLKIFNDT
jgi:uncharacterized repeat protein (TIGR04138 family)